MGFGDPGQGRIRGASENAHLDSGPVHVGKEAGDARAFDHAFLRSGALGPALEDAIVVIETVAGRALEAIGHGIARPP